MKLAISILMGNKGSIRDRRDTQTSNAKAYSARAEYDRTEAARCMRRAEENDRAAERAATSRNQLQVELNQLDAAIAKLEE